MPSLPEHPARPAPAALRLGREVRLARDLVASDRRYFAAGARRTAAGAAAIWHLAGFEALSVGGVVDVVPERIPGSPAAFLRHVERRLRALGCAFSRFYLEESSPLASMLTAAGYVSRVELGFLGEPTGSRARRARHSGLMVLRAIRTKQQWAAKLEVHRLTSRSPDGHRVPAALFLDMERRKCRVGYMRPYLIELDGRVAGAVNVAPCGRILRMKNLVVSPAYRRQGLATRFAQGLVQMAVRHGYEAAGCFAIVGEPGVRIYPAAGYRVVVRQVEWLKSLDGKGS